MIIVPHIAFDVAFKCTENIDIKRNLRSARAAGIYQLL